MNNTPIIRKYKPGDHAAVRSICYETGFMGNPASVYFDDEELFSDMFTIFIDYEPESCYVAEVNGKVAGYFIGTCTSEKMERIFKKQVFPKILLKAFRTRFLLNKKHWRFIFSVLLSAGKGELSFPDVSREYPATFHTNMREEYRGAGLGSKLMHTFMDYIHSKKVKGVHCGTISDKARDYYIKKGFALLATNRVTYLKPFTGKTFFYYLLGKKM